MPGEFKAAAERQGIETTVDDAIRKGKIAASRRKHWVSLIGADRGMSEGLASVPNETAFIRSNMQTNFMDNDDRP